MVILPVAIMKGENREIDNMDAKSLLKSYIGAKTPSIPSSLKGSGLSAKVVDKGAFTGSKAGSGKGTSGSKSSGKVWKMRKG
jgi:hypothetical protein